MKLYAQPLDGSHGFYFDDYEDYKASLKHTRAEEFELQFIDGDNDECELFKACEVNQANLEQWLDWLYGADDQERVQMYWRTNEQGYGFADSLDNYQDAMVYPGTLKDYAEQYIDDTGALDGLPENLRYYFDYDAFARDLQLGGDMSEFEFDGETYCGDNHS